MMGAVLFYLGLIAGAMLSGYFVGQRNWAMAVTALIPPFFFLIKLIGAAP